MKFGGLITRIAYNWRAAKTVTHVPQKSAKHASAPTAKPYRHLARGGYVQSDESQDDHCRWALSLPDVPDRRRAPRRTWCANRNPAVTRRPASRRLHATRPIAGPRPRDPGRT